jgi:hypothetical protein
VICVAIPKVEWCVWPLVVFHPISPSSSGLASISRARLLIETQSNSDLFWYPVRCLCRQLGDTRPRVSLWHLYNRWTTAYFAGHVSPNCHLPNLRGLSGSVRTKLKTRVVDLTSPYLDFDRIGPLKSASYFKGFPVRMRKTTKWACITVNWLAEI